MSTIDAPAHHFDDLEQQHEAGRLGMWVFLITEVMFFGGLFLVYAVYRSMKPDEFAAASRRLDVTLGSLNTAILLLSSFTMAIGLHAARGGARRAVTGWLALTMALGTTFLVVKGIEYAHKAHEGLVPGHGFNGPADRETFYALYFVMTGTHALHMVIGIAVLGVVAAMAWRGRFTGRSHAPVELGGLYWHFVDIVWIYLFPLLYLVERHA